MAKIGQVFTNRKARKAFKTSKLNSIINENNQKLRIIFRNETRLPLTLCWVGNNGDLHHYYRLNRCSTVVTAMGHSHVHTKLDNIHLENTCVGHSFVFGTCVSKEASPLEGGNNDESKQIGDIIAGYRPTKPSLSGSDQNCVHMVTITEQEGFQEKLGWKRNRPRYEVKVSQCEIESIPLDTTNKVYIEMNIGGWKCKCEEGLFSCKNDGGEEDIMFKVKQRIEIDLLAATKKLPPHAYKLLKESTLIWINKNLKYGPRAAPVLGRGMCFHPGSDWLVENGMSASKCGGVEIYEAERYLDDVDLWFGKGGVIIHEMSHAWHNKFIKDGYENEEIKECYKAAMKENLYDCVKVHDKDGSNECKAYACTDAMEYFAELSVAFLGGVGPDEDLEYNKWYPFNRKQLQAHDPRAFELLQKMWGMKNEEDVIVIEESN